MIDEEYSAAKPTEAFIIVPVSLNSLIKPTLVKRCVFFAGLCLISIFVLAQPCSLDSIFAAKNSSVFTSDNEKGVCYIDVGIELANKEQKLECGIAALDRAIPFLEDSLQIVRATCIKGLILVNLGRYEEAKRALLEILAFCEKKKPFIDKTYLNWIIEGVYDGLAQSCIFTGDYGRAINFAYTSLELGLLFPEKADICGKYVDLALLYYKIRDNATAVQMYKRAIPLETNFAVGYPATLSNLALCYSEMDSIKQAVFYLDSAAVAMQNSVYKGGLFWDFAHGMIDLKKKEFDSARKYFKKSLRKSIAWNYPRMIADNHAYLARAYLLTGEYDSARQALSNGEAIAIEQNFNEILLDIYRQSIVLFKATGDYSRLSEYQRKFIDQKSGMYSVEVARDLAVVQGKMVERDHLTKLDFQQRQIETQEDILRSQRWIQQTSIGIGLLLMILALLQYGISLERKKIKAALYLKVSERANRLSFENWNTLRLSHKLKAAETLLTAELQASENLFDSVVVRPGHVGSDLGLNKVK